MKTNTLTPELLQKMDACWRAANYLPVGQIYLYDNPLLKRPLELENTIDMIYVSGPGHGAPAVVGNTYLEDTYSEIYPNISQDEAGLRKLFVQFSRRNPESRLARVSGSIHEGGELEYRSARSLIIPI